MFGPLDLQRLAVRIERLQAHVPRTYRWGADGMDFRNHMPGGRIPNALPEPEFLRDLADNYKDKDSDEMQLAKRKWRIWIQVALRMEGLIPRNDPNNPRNIMRQMARGKYPLF